MTHTKVMEFVEENLKTIFAYSLSRVSNKEDAEDLTNDIVLAILQSADKLKNFDAFYGYVWAIAANTYKKFLQKRNRVEFTEMDENISDDADFTEEILVREEVHILHREIALLSKEYRECTVAYYFDGLSCAETAQKLNLSLEMVKYYLFKTRKILKEGICMEREFGEKSFRPAPFIFITVFNEMDNPEYRNLFSRKLPGQILLSAYYTPMTIRELAVELGVAALYLEDEIALLEKYNLVKALPAGKYQTNLMIFTDEFMKELQRKAEEFSVYALGQWLSNVKAKLAEVRTVNAICAALSDNKLLWGLLWPMILKSHEEMSKLYPQYGVKTQIYEGATGVNFGISETKIDDKFECKNFAGCADNIGGNYFTVAADFGILPEKNRYFEKDNSKVIAEKICKTLNGEIEPEFMILTKAEEQKIFAILKEEISELTIFYRQLFSCACNIMRNHAPKNLGNQIEQNMFQALYFRTLGMVGYFAVKSKGLEIPEEDGPAAMYVREKEK